MTVVVSRPTHLWRPAALAGPTITLEVDRPVALGQLLDALEELLRVLRGTIRDHPGPDGSPGALRPVRFFALDSDLTQEGLAVVLPRSGGRRQGETTDHRAGG